MNGPEGIPDRLRCGGHARGERRRGFTLLELLITVSVMALLISLLLPSLAAVRQQAKSFLCMDHGRAAAVEFRIFADNYAHGYRGDSENLAPRFDALDFVESLYGVDEFWSAVRKGDRAYEPYRPGQKPIVCPSGPQGLARVNGVPMEKPFVDPRDRVSYAVNRRLFRAPVRKFGAPYEEPVLLSERILNHPYVPLLFDVNAEAATKVGLPPKAYLPFFCAPDFLGRPYWFPAPRHRGKLTVTFVGGHVLSSASPLAERDWDWEYYPTIHGP